MKRLFALSGLLAALCAHAEWYPVAVPGTPNEVTIISVDGGRFVVATTSGLFDVRDGGVAQSVAAGTNVAWGNADGGCVYGISVAPAERVSSCAPATAVGSTVSQVYRVADLGGTRYLYGRNTATATQLFFEDETGAVTAIVAPSFGLVPAAQAPPIAGYESGGKSFAVVVSNFSRLGFLEDVADRGRYDAGLVALELSTFMDGLVPSALIGTNAASGSDAIAIVSVPPLSQPPLERASTPGNISRVTGVAFTSQTNAAGNALADGFGMACGQDALGASVVLQPLPDPGNPARVWLPNTNQSALDGGLTRVVCEAGKLCVVMTNRASGDNLFVYENRFAPSFPGAGAGSVASGGSLAVDLGAVDNDGDPLRYGTLTVSPTGAGTSVQTDAGVVQFTAGPVCGAAQVVSFSLVASDGVNDSTGAFNLTINPGAPAQPSVSGSIVLQAGTDAGRIEVTPNAGDCATTDVRWTLLDGGGLFAAVEDAGYSRLFTPPEHFCSATPGVAVYSVEALSDAQAAPPQIVTATLLPWGAPEQPFATDLSVFIDAGETFVLTRDAGHFCANAPVDTIWSLPAVDGGVRANGTPLTAPTTVVSDTLTLATAPCINAVFDVPVRNETANQLSLTPDPVLHVTVAADLTAGSVELSKLTGTPFDGGLLVTAGANFVCAGTLGYSAVVTVAKDGNVIADAGVSFSPTEGTFFVPFVDCAGGSYELTAALVNPDGGTAGVSAASSISVPPGSVPAPTLIVDDSSVSCGTGGAAVLSVEPQLRCAGLSYAWQPISGLAVEPIADGETATLRTSSTQLGDILGEKVSVQVTPSSGGRQFPSTIADVTFELPPFVTVEHETDTPITSDTELFGVTVTLTNTLDCEVRDVDYVETLTQTRVVPQSVRVNGNPVEVGAPDSLVQRIVIGSRTMAVRGITLPPGEPVRITYSARSVLFGAAKPSGKAVLRFSEASEYDISEEAGFAREPGSAPPGCGCGVTSLNGVFALLAASLFARGRRRSGPGRFPVR